VPRSLSDEELKQIRQRVARADELLAAGDAECCDPDVNWAGAYAADVPALLAAAEAKVMQTVRAENVVPQVTIVQHSAPPLCQCSRMVKHFRDDPWPPGDGPIAMQVRR
jgi:hypothetical protein